MTRTGPDRGAAEAFGLVVVFPAMLGLALLVVAFGRSIDSRSQARSTAEAAAQAAALERSPAAAARAVENVVALTLGSSTTCVDAVADVDWSAPASGRAGRAAVTITCTRPGDGLHPVGVTDRRNTVTAFAAIDPLRAGARDETSRAVRTPPGSTPARLTGERGTSMAVALVLLFTFTAGAIVWLSRDVDQTVALRSTAQSIAFQAARAGAQEVEVIGLRAGDGDVDVAVDGERAIETATGQASEMMAAYGVVGTVIAVTVDDGAVTVEVRLEGPGGLAVTGFGAARAEAR